MRAEKKKTKNFSFSSIFIDVVLMECVLFEEKNEFIISLLFLHFITNVRCLLKFFVCFWIAFHCNVRTRILFILHFFLKMIIKNLKVLLAYSMFSIFLPLFFSFLFDFLFFFSFSSTQHFRCEN